MADEKTQKQTFTKEQFEVMPEGFKALLKENGDSYEFAFETPESVAALKNAVTRERTESSTLKTQLSSLQAVLGTMKPEEAEQVLKDAKKAQEEALALKNDLPTIKKNWYDETAKPLEQERDEWQQTAQNAIVKAGFHSAIEKVGGKPGAADVLFPHFKDYVKWEKVEKNGKATYEPRLYIDDVMQMTPDGKPIDWDAFVDKQFRQVDKFGYMFEPSSNGGGGSQAHTQTNGGSKVAWSSLGNRAKAEAIAKHGTLDEARKHFA